MKTTMPSMPSILSTDTQAVVNICKEIFSDPKLYTATLITIESELTAYIPENFRAILNQFSADRLEGLAYVASESPHFSLYLPPKQSADAVETMEVACGQIIQCLARYLLDKHHLKLYAVNGYWDPKDADKTLMDGAIFYEATENNIYPLRHGMLTHIFQIAILLSWVKPAPTAATRLLKGLLTPVQLENGHSIKLWDHLLDGYTANSPPNFTPEAHHVFMLHHPGLVGDIGRLFYETLIHKQAQLVPALDFVTNLMVHSLYQDAFLAIDLPSAPCPKAFPKSNPIPNQTRCRAGRHLGYSISPLRDG
jgi:hypothetical protein